jgi:hypothetical protein
MEARAATFVRAAQGAERQSEDRVYHCLFARHSPQSICFITATVCPCALEFHGPRNKNKEMAC